MNDMHKIIERIKTAESSIREYTEGVWDGNREGFEAIADSLLVAIEALEHIT